MINQENKIRIGELNKLIINRSMPQGWYLTNEFGDEVLLPNAYTTPEMSTGDEIEVFVYTDSEDRLVATTLKPLAIKNEFAYLETKVSNRLGAFMDWGLPKDLFVPHAEQRETMYEGESYVVYVFLDVETNRMVGSTKLGKFLANDEPKYALGQKVECLVYGVTEIGYECLVDSAYRGMIYKSEIFKQIAIGDKLQAYVKQVRTDFKIDLVAEPIGIKKLSSHTEIVLQYLRQSGGIASLSDKSNPELIYQELGMSKKAFKMAIGQLYKNRFIEILDTSIRLVSGD